MPQFELERVGPRAINGLYRGLDAIDALRRALEIDAETPVAVGESSGAAGWQEVTLDGAPAGRVRLHQRMRFRRD
jgi:hypothetical protein